nr:hypothetical protein GCM10020092_061160 [Actinoplanes digitatis]
MDLCVGVLEGDVVDSLGQCAGALDRGRRDVHAERGAGAGRTRGLPGRLAGAAAEVEDMVVEPKADRAAQHLVVPSQFGVVARGGCHHGPLTTVAAYASRRSASSRGGG